MILARWASSTTLTPLLRTRLHTPSELTQRRLHLPSTHTPTHFHRSQQRDLTSIGRVYASSSDLQGMVLQKNAENPLIVYSRTTCPFCADVRKLFDSYKVKSKFIELDYTVEGDDVQEILTGITGSQTVPQVFIGGSFVGGFDDTLALHQQGKLKSMLEAANVEFRR